MFVCQLRHCIILHRCFKGIGHIRIHANQHWLTKGLRYKKRLINHSCHECYEDVKFVNFIVPKLLWWTRLLMPMLLNFDGHFQ